MAFTDIPTQARGTMTIGGREYHQRLDKYGQLMLVAGPDPRDWDKIDRGALDYTKIASQEHGQPGFTGHDGPKIAAACHLCNGTPSNEDLITQKTRALINAKKAGTLADGMTADDVTTKAPVEVTGEVPVLLDSETALDIARREAQAEIAALRADLDHQERDMLAGKADLPPLTPEQAAALDASNQAAKLAAMEAEADAAKARDMAEFDRKITDATMGTDPFTGAQVKITKQLGADAQAPYGRKKDGTPRRQVGTKPAGG